MCCSAGTIVSGNTEQGLHMQEVGIITDREIFVSPCVASSKQIIFTVSWRLLLSLQHSQKRSTDPGLSIDGFVYDVHVPRQATDNSALG